MERKCLNETCQNFIDNPKRSYKKFCCDKCRYEYHGLGKNNYKRTNPDSKINTRQIGFLSELKVTADLTLEGYEVFLPLYNATCDMIALKDGKAKRIEVKTGFIKAGKLRTGAIKLGFYDILAIYSPSDDTITYIPPLE